jgi:aldehyde:ferredoxin oxidoreductase
MAKGYMGRILWVDLSRGEIREESVPDTIYEHYLSGMGLAAYLGVFTRMLPTQMAMDGMIEKILLRKWGTSSLNQASIEMGDAPIKNWKGTHLDFGLKKSLPTNPGIIKRVERVKYHYHASLSEGCQGLHRLRILRARMPGERHCHVRPGKAPAVSGA